MFCKTLWNSLGVVKLLCIYSSTKDKLLLKYFIRKIIWKNTSNSSCLFLVFLNIVIRTFFCFLCPGPATKGRGGGWGGSGGNDPPTFLRNKKKKKKQRKKTKSFNAEANKRLSPKSKCYCFSHSWAPRIQKFFLSANHDRLQYFWVFHGPSALKSISPALYV